MKRTGFLPVWAVCAAMAFSLVACDDDENEKGLFVPSATVTNLAFTDTDGDPLKIAGTVSWTEPASTQDITGYTIYLGENATDKGTKVGETAVGASTFEIKPAVDYKAYLLVVAKNGSGESEKVASIAVDDAYSGLYILNGGNYEANNAALNFYNPSTGSLTDLYKVANGANLGESAQDMLIYGSKMYVAVTFSNRLAVLDRTGKLLKSIEPKDAEGNTLNPRYLAAADGKVYMTYFYGHSVAVLDTASLEVEKEVKVGRYPEQVAVANGKVYVANSGGNDFPNYGNTVSVVDPVAGTVEKNIEVVINPCSVAADNRGNVYVVSMGDYGAVKNTLQRIDASTGEVTVMGNGSKITIVNDKLYVVYAQYGEPEPTYKKYDALTGELESDRFVTEASGITSPGCLEVDPSTGKIYISEAPYGETAMMYVFTPDGKLDGKPFDTGGYETKKVCFQVK